ncbi:DeoR/GlpR family DNA-binding transcription regulator [Pseudoxanthobacter sp.]|uniref:DeoR/GlpR family DNA-binding transcription regulator n=1 Tax=Pseudoxanthobacter sp. TaxID=1925742 RepID=UPI002FE31466
MLPARRHAKIVEHLRLAEAASLTELAEATGTSLSTVRRDVDALCESGVLERTRGGAMLSAKTAFEMDPQIARAVAEPAKAAIAREAALLIAPGQSVLFDSGSTVAAVAAAALARAVPFTAVTNDLSIAGALAQVRHVTVHVPEGHIRPGSATIWGARTVECLTRLRCDLAFIGTHAIDEAVVSDGSLELAELKRAMMAAARRTVLVADSGKFFSRVFCAFATPAAFGTIITDAGIAVSALEALAATGASVVVAGGEP